MRYRHGKGQALQTIAVERAPLAGALDAVALLVPLAAVDTRRRCLIYQHPRIAWLTHTLPHFVDH